MLDFFCYVFLFRNGEFEMTTDSTNNTFIQDSILYLVPTLTSDVIGRDNVLNGFTFNLTGCTAPPPPAAPANSTSSNSTTTANSTSSVSGGRGSQTHSLTPSPSPSGSNNNNDNNDNNNNNDFFINYGSKDDNNTSTDDNGNPTANGPISASSPGINQACRAVSSRTGKTAINPVMSSRISTRGKKNIRYGKVEVRAKMPVG